MLTFTKRKDGTLFCETAHINIEARYWRFDYYLTIGVRKHPTGLYIPVFHSKALPTPAAVAQEAGTKYNEYMPIVRALIEEEPTRD